MLVANHEDAASVSSAVGRLPASVGSAGGTDLDQRQARLVPARDRYRWHPTRVLVEQVGAVDVQRLGNLESHLTREEQWGVDAALLTVLGLN